jgi:hypothetical protein
MKARRNMGNSARGQRVERTSVMLRTGMYPGGQFYGNTDASAGSGAEIAGQLAQMVGMITSTAIAAKSAQQTAAISGRYGVQQTEAEAALAEKQGLLAAAQAKLVSAQQGYVLPVTAAVVGTFIVLGIYAFRK